VARLRPLMGGGIAAGFGIRWVFAITAVLLAAILAWVWFTVPDLKKEQEDGRLTRSLQACGQ
jgi:predicted MFS family arabinose efflux permease